MTWALGLGLIALVGCGGGHPAAGTSSVSGTVYSPGALSGSHAVAPEIVSRQKLPWIMSGEAQAQRAEVVPGEYLVRVQGALEASPQALSVQGAQLRPVRQLLPGLVLYRAVGGALSAQASGDVLRALSAHPQVLSAEPNYRERAFAVPNDPFFALQWDQHLMNLPEAWTHASGSGVVVAVIDSGIVAHPDLRGQVVGGYDFVSDVANAGDGDGWDPDPTDEGGESDYHGSHVAGTIAAVANNAMGIAGGSWGARITAVRTLGVSGGGSLSDRLAAMVWAAGLAEIEGVPNNPYPARIVNLSLGSERACSDAEQVIFDAMVEAGVIPVVAAGNENIDASRAAPANCRNVITVGAIGPDGKRAYYSNYGARIDVMAPGGNLRLKYEVDGEEYPAGVLSTVLNEHGQPAYAFYQGTSMAAPQVSALAALLLSRQPTLDFEQVRSRLMQTARPMPACDVPRGCGSGVVDAMALLTGTTSDPAPLPPVQEMQTYVFMFEWTDRGLGRGVQRVRLDQQALRNDYRIGNVAAGNYVMAAFQDLDGDGNVDELEPLGIHEDVITVTQVPQHYSGIDIYLEPFVSSSAALSLTPASLRERMRQELGKR
nr:S8 family peptidase [Deinobacterium chartae]